MKSIMLECKGNRRSNEKNSTLKLGIPIMLMVVILGAVIVSELPENDTSIERITYTIHEQISMKDSTAPMSISYTAPVIEETDSNGGGTYDLVSIVLMGLLISIGIGYIMIRKNNYFGAHVQSVMFVLFGLVFALGLMYLMEPVSGASIYVSPDGSDSSGDGSEGDPYLTIGKAIDEASTISTDTIYVKPGTYKEEITIGKSLNLQSSGIEYFYIIGDGDGSVVTVSSNTDNVTINGFRITGGTTGIDVLSGCENVTISNCDIYDNGTSSNNRGVYAYDGETLEISNCRIYNNYEGIYIHNFDSSSSVSQPFLIENCEIIGNEYIGIYVYHCDNDNFNESPLHDLYVYENRYGIYLSQSINDDTSAIQPYIDSCYVYDNTDHGISLSNTDKIIISNSYIFKNEDNGIYLTNDSDSNSIYHNSITWNGISQDYGIDIGQSTCNLNDIYSNDIIDNLSNAYDAATDNTWDNGSDSGNYWSDYTGDDSDEDGIGDTSYSGDGNAEDDYPLMDLVDGVVVDNTNQNPDTDFPQGTFQYPITSINTAYDDASNPSNIFIVTGTYTENVSIDDVNQSINIIGQDKTEVTIDDASESGAGISISSGPDSNFFYGLEITDCKHGIIAPTSHNRVSHCTLSSNDYWGVRFSDPTNSMDEGWNILTHSTLNSNLIGCNIQRAKKNYVQFCTLSTNNKDGSNNYGYGIYINSSSCASNDYNRIIECTMEDNDTYGIYADESEYSLIEDSVCSNTTTTDQNSGIYLEASDYLWIVNSTCNKNDSMGIYLWYSDYNHVIDNVCNENSTNGIYVYHSHYNNLDSNGCDDNDSRGIALYYSDYNTLYNNNCRNSQGSSAQDIGIRLSHSDHNTLTYNDLVDNDSYGIYLVSSGLNSIYYNDFDGNGGTNSQAYDDHTNNNNDWDDGSSGNSWSDLGERTVYPIDGDAGAEDGKPQTDKFDDDQ